MTTHRLRLVRFGAARILTRDGMPGDYNEVHIADSLYPPAG